MFSHIANALFSTLESFDICWKVEKLCGKPVKFVSKFWISTAFYRFCKLIPPFFQQSTVDSTVFSTMCQKRCGNHSFFLCFFILYPLHFQQEYGIMVVYYYRRVSLFCKFPPHKRYVPFKFQLMEVKNEFI